MTSKKSHLKDAGSVLVVERADGFIVEEHLSGGGRLSTEQQRPHRPPRGREPRDWGDTLVVVGLGRAGEGGCNLGQCLEKKMQIEDTVGRIE